MKNSLSFGPTIIITIVLSLKEGVQLNLQFTFDPKSQIDKSGGREMEYQINLRNVHSCRFLFEAIIDISQVV